MPISSNHRFYYVSLRAAVLLAELPDWLMCRIFNAYFEQPQFFIMCTHTDFNAYLEQLQILLCIRAVILMPILNNYKFYYVYAL